MRGQGLSGFTSRFSILSRAGSSRGCGGVGLAGGGGGGGDGVLDGFGSAMLSLLWNKEVCNRHLVLYFFSEAANETCILH